MQDLLLEQLQARKNRKNYALVTIVDSFGSFLNPVVNYINSISFSQFEFGYSSALSWIYFLCIALIIAVIYLLFRKKIFYQT